MNFTQENRAMSVTTPLGADVLLLHSMTAKEGLGQLFEFSLDLLSENESIALYHVLGQAMTIKAPLPAGGDRYFHGFVSRFTQVDKYGKFAKYRATLVPWFWFLTRSADCRIFQLQTVPEIIQAIFRGKGFTDFKTSLAGTYRQWEYCVQYRESDFNFISRLMEQEGIYYYFKHESGRHVLVLADDVSSHAATSDYEELPYYPLDIHNRRECEHIFDWSVSREVQSGAYVLDDFDFERPRTQLLVTSKVTRAHAHSNFEVFDYPGEFLQTADGDGYVKKRIQEKQAEHERVQGQAEACGLQVGALFSLADYPRSDQNREYLLISTEQHLLNTEYETGERFSGTSWKCSFEAMESKQQFRSRRRTVKPAIQGPQTAVVVGKQGEEIWTDKYGRVKVQFHWDRYGLLDENSSCWVRVAQLWAGKTWGAMHIPRIGQEVIVEFLEGDPDRPIVTGRVYNADEMPPYELPTNQTQSGIKSRSSKEATNQNFNELRFEDKKGEEHVYFHAEKDFARVVENNDSLKVGFEKKDVGDQVIEIHNNQLLKIGNSESKDGSQTIEVWKNVTETIKTGDAALTITKGKRTTTIEVDDALTLNTGNAALTISKGKRTTAIEGDDALTLKTGNLIIAIDSGLSKIEAAKSILLTVGESSIKIEPTCITLKSMAIKILGEASVDLKSPMTKCIGTGQLVLKGGITMIN